MKRILLVIVALAAVFTTLSAQMMVVEAPETDAVYRIPLKKGVVVQAERLSPLACGMAQHLNLVDFCAWKFATKVPSEVYAARGGVVIETARDRVRILHEDGIYTDYLGVTSVKVAQGEKVKAGEPIASARVSNPNNPDLCRWNVVIIAFHFRTNPQYGQFALNGAYEHLMQFVDPIFTTRGECKTHLADGGAYTVRTRTWCWPWE